MCSSAKLFGRLIFAGYLFAALCAAQPSGGAYVWWDPIYPTPAYDTYEWTMTVVQQVIGIA
jgi:hypothetical protein